MTEGIGETLFHEGKIDEAADAVANTDQGVKAEAFAIYYGVESIRFINRDSEGEFALLDESYGEMSQEILDRTNIEISKAIVANRYRTARWLVDAKRAEFMKNVCYTWHANAASKGVTYREFTKNPSKYKGNVGTNSGENLLDSTPPKLLSHARATVTSIKRLMERCDREAIILDEEGEHARSRFYQQARIEWAKALPVAREAVRQMEGRS